MFDMLTTTELTVLQSMLFEGTEEACRVADLNRTDADSFRSYRPVHSEVGLLFIEIGTELLGRLDAEAEAELLECHEQGIKAA
jgi:hypothetical protein